MEYVLIRDDKAGVFVGQLIERTGKQWKLCHSRKIHYWTKAGAVEGIAAYGPGPGSRVCVLRELPVTGYDAVEIVRLTPDEYAAIMAYPEWRP